MKNPTLLGDPVSLKVCPRTPHLFLICIKSMGSIEQGKGGDGKREERV